VRPVVRARVVEVGALPIEDVVLTGTAEVERYAGVRNGLVTFGRVATTGLVFTEGRAAIVVDARHAKLDNVTAKVNSGTVVGGVALDLGAGTIGWQMKLDAKGVRLSTEHSRVLSFLVPILRLTGRGGRERLTGVLDASLDLSAQGTSVGAVVSSLAGAGGVTLREMEVEGSVLLALLSLRADKLVRDRAYRFSDTKVDFRIRDHTVFPKPFRLNGEPLGLKIDGHARLDGELDFLISPDLLPIPLRVTGPIDGPRVVPAPLARLPFK
jgi:hypothetical protein